MLAFILCVMAAVTTASIPATALAQEDDPGAQEPADVFTVGADDARRLLSLTEGVAVALGWNRERPILFAIDPSRSTGGEPPPDFGRAELEGCPNEGANRCCYPSTGTRWFNSKANGWVNLNIGCEDEPVNGGKTPPLVVDSPLSDILARLGQLTDPHLSVGNTRQQSHLLYLKRSSKESLDLSLVGVAHAQSSPCYGTIDVCSANGEIPDTKLCRKANKYFYRWRTCDGDQEGFKKSTIRCTCK